MTEQTKREQAIEKLAEYIHDRLKRSAYKWSAEKADVKDSYIEIALDFILKLESLGMCFKAEDQELSKLRNFKETVMTCHNTKAEWFKDGQKVAQQDMLEDHWVRIKE